MARRKQVAPMPRINSGEVMQTLPDRPEQRAAYTNGHVPSQKPRVKQEYVRQRPQMERFSNRPAAGVWQLLLCVGGIYASFLTWALLQERITTTPYSSVSIAILKSTSSHEYFRFPIFLNTIQAAFAFVSGSIYLIASNTKSSKKIVPSRASFGPILLVTLTTTFASPFGYASLAHVDYLTFVLAKSCKLLPVMFLHITLFQKRYPLSKYLIVLAVTAGVVAFTLYNPPKSGKASKSAKQAQSSSYYGLALLGINLLFDGLTNTVQDHIFKSPLRYGIISGPQMMVIQNFLATFLMAAYILLTPYIPISALPIWAQTSQTHELSNALAFLRRHPFVLYDCLGFAVCGAIGQLFIFATLERFSSLLLVTVTVTRKMLTMLLSVVWYGKSLTQGQWMGVGLVFGGIGTEALLAAEEKKVKEREKEKRNL